MIAVSPATFLAIKEGANPVESRRRVDVGVDVADLHKSVDALLPGHLSDVTGCRSVHVLIRVVLGLPVASDEVVDGVRVSQAFGDLVRSAEVEFLQQS